MEIIHLILGKANPNRMNGVNKFVYELASKQKASGRNVAVWGVAKDTSRNFEERNFETKIFKRESKPFCINEDLKVAIQSTTTNKTVFHLHGGWVPLNYALALFIKKNNKEFVLTPHGAYNTIAMKRSKWQKKIYFALFEKKLLKAAKKIHSIGNSEIDGLQNIWVNNKSCLIPYGYEYQQEIEKKTINSSKFIIGFIGRIDIYTKGLDILLEGFTYFQKRNKNAELWIVGDGEELETLKNSVARNKMENIVFLGSKFGAEKFKVLQQMNVFVHSSRNEGLPASILEAAFFGLPCIVSKETNFGVAISEHNAGKTLQENTAICLSVAIESLYSAWQKNTLVSYAENAKAMINTTYNWNNLVLEYDRLYQ